MQSTLFVYGLRVETLRGSTEVIRAGQMADLERDLTGFRIPVYGGEG